MANPEEVYQRMIATFEREDMPGHSTQLRKLAKQYVNELEKLPKNVVQEAMQPGGTLYEIMEQMVRIVGNLRGSENIRFNEFADMNSVNQAIGRFVNKLIDDEKNRRGMYDVNTVKPSYFSKDEGVTVNFFLVRGDGKKISIPVNITGNGFEDKTNIKDAFAKAGIDITNKQVGLLLPKASQAAGNLMKMGPGTDSKLMEVTVGMPIVNETPVGKKVALATGR